MSGRPDAPYIPIQLNLNVRGLKPSATLAINERSNALREQGRMIYKLGLGQSPFPVPEPVVAALQQNAFQKEYLAVKGLRELREAVANYNRSRRMFGCTADDILIGPGSKELMFLIQLVYYGDLVIPTPSWVSYAPQAHIIGRHVRWLKARSEDGWRLTPEELESLCREDDGRPRLVILNYPSNPTGLTYTGDELEALAHIARKHRLLILSDEIYGELHFQGEHQSIAHYYPEGTIVSGGMSKWCGAGGWRLGTFTFPQGLAWLRDAMANVASETYTATSAPIQYAAVRAFQGGPEIERYLIHSRRILAALGKACAAALQEAGVRVHDPEGGFYLFPDFASGRERLRSRGIETGAQLCERLLDDTGVALLPGSDFGCPPGDLTARLAYVDFDGARALAASLQEPGHAIDAHFLETYCANVMEAVRLIGQWLRA